MSFKKIFKSVTFSAKFSFGLCIVTAGPFLDVKFKHFLNGKPGQMTWKIVRNRTEIESCLPSFSFFFWSLWPFVIII